MAGDKENVAPMDLPYIAGHQVQFDENHLVPGQIRRPHGAGERQNSKDDQADRQQRKHLIHAGHFFPLLTGPVPQRRIGPV